MASTTRTVNLIYDVGGGSTGTPVDSGAIRCSRNPIGNTTKAKLRYETQPKCAGVPIAGSTVCCHKVMEQETIGKIFGSSSLRKPCGWY